MKLAEDPDCECGKSRQTDTTYVFLHCDNFKSERLLVKKKLVKSGKTKNVHVLKMQSERNLPEQEHVQCSTMGKKMFQIENG